MRGGCGPQAVGHGPYACPLWRTLRMLSPYLITAATSRPPEALRAMRMLVGRSMPCMSPCASTCSLWPKTAKHASGMVNRQSCTLRTQSEGGLASLPLTCARTSGHGGDSVKRRLERGGAGFDVRQEDDKGTAASRTRASKYTPANEERDAASSAAHSP